VPVVYRGLIKLSDLENKGSKIPAKYYSLKRKMRRAKRKAALKKKVTRVPKGKQLLKGYKIHKSVFPKKKKNKKKK